MWARLSKRQEIVDHGERWAYDYLAKGCWRANGQKSHNTSKTDGTGTAGISKPHEPAHLEGVVQVVSGMSSRSRWEAKEVS